ncbi:hypothetical protein BTA51_06340 [Hahella sp. CCB-MM4]|nr:hypothetical protein BTA51_06340 [Hahella sp. CCB-MM4]
MTSTFTVKGDNLAFDLEETRFLLYAPMWSADWLYSGVSLHGLAVAALDVGCTGSRQVSVAIGRGHNATTAHLLISIERNRLPRRNL